MRRRLLVGFSAMLAFSGILAAQETAANPELDHLKAQLAAQQEQIDQLRRALDDQKKMLEQASRPQPPNLGQIASVAPVIPAGEAAALHPGLPAALHPQAPGEEPASPLQLRIGTATITPVGFMDFTEVFRTRDIGSSIGTNFGGTPYSNAPLGNLSESRFSAQNSRIGARVDALVHGARVMGYWESDFLGIQGANAPVSTNSNSFRIRLYWVDVRKDKWEILGGQSWSMLTPNRKGLSPLPADIFYSQDMDTNYQLGLSWTRAPQFRFVYHPSDIVSWGFALESAEQYGGGTNGSGAITLPASLATAYANQIQTGSQTFNVPNVSPDFQTKLALDPMVNGKLMHVEFGGFLSAFRTYNPTTNQHFSKPGGGGEVNFNLELVKNFHLIANTFFSDGGGRYIFGQAPDLIIRQNGSISPVHTYSTVDGFEYTAHNTVFYAYYGGVDIGRNFAIDTSGKKPAYIGYGFPGSGNSNNRVAQEVTFGVNPTFWKNPTYGALGMFLQYSYLFRDPWSPASTGPRNANNNMIWIDLRYTLPGQAPTYR